MNQSFPKYYGKQQPDIWFSFDANGTDKNKPA